MTDVLFDSHVHLDDERHDLLAIGAMVESLENTPWIGAMIAGYGPERYVRARRLCDRLPQLGRSVGLHPWWLAAANRSQSDRESGWQQLLDEIATHRPAALGEFGFDRNVRSRLPLDEQRQWLDRALVLAAELSLPVIMHLVGWYGHALELLQDHQRPYLGVLHRYSGPLELVRPFEDLGLSLSFGLDVLARPAVFESIVAEVSIDRLLIETDWPGRSGDYPEAVGRLSEVVETIATWRSVDAASLGRQTASNAVELYSLDSSPVGLR